jgi:DNA-binding XRE family transcriptional regulator
MATIEKSRTGPADLAHEALTMAFAILVERIQRLPNEDRRDLFELVKEIPTAATCEDMESIVLAMREILEQEPIRVRRVEQPAQEAPAGEGLQKWMDYVGERIRSLRIRAGLTQSQLAEKSGLPQSHISRLEIGKHSPSRATIEKIATALGLPVSEFDPSA